MESGSTPGGVLGTMQWTAEAAQRYPWWVVVGVLVGAALWLLWGQLENRWEHNRKIETERMHHDLALERDWLTAALRADDPEELVPIARALGFGTDRISGQIDPGSRREGTSRSEDQTAEVADKPPRDSSSGIAVVGSGVVDPGDDTAGRGGERGESS